MTTKKSILTRRPIVAWAMYDWANSAFAATVIAVFFPVYYSALSAELSARDSQFWFNFALAVSSLIVAVSAPLLGALADRAGRKKFLAAFALLGILMSAALAFVQAGMWQLGLLVYALGAIGFSGANIFYDAMLVEVAEPKHYDLASAYGYALGYLGGGLLLGVNVLMVTQPQWFGFADASVALSAAFISVALWWGVFSLPLLLRKSMATPSSPRKSMRATIAELKQTFIAIRQNKNLFVLLIAYFLYIDGVGTIIKVAVFFGNRILQLPRASLITAVLITQFIAFPAALAFGRLGERIGARRAILLGVMVYCAVIVYAWRWLNSAADFYYLAIAIGLVQGGVQSLSRSLYARFIPPRRSAEFFGVFNMVGKFAAILGPLLLAVTPFIFPFADARDSILSLLILFVAGGWLLWKVKTPA